MMQIYDRVLASGSEETLVALFLLVVGLYSIMALLDFARGRIMARVGARMQDNLDQRVFDASMEKGLTTDPHKPKGAELRDVETLRSFFSSSVAIAICDVPWSPVFFAALFLFHPMLGWLGIFGGLTLVILTIINQVLTRSKSRSARGASETAQRFGAQSQDSSELILSQGMQADIVSRWGDYRHISLKQHMLSNDLSGAFVATSKSFRMLLQSAVLAYGAYFVLKGELTGGAIIAGSISLGRALQPVEQILNGLPQIQKCVSSWKNLDRLLSKFPSPGQKHGLSTPKANLVVSNLTIQPIGSDTTTLRNVSFSVKQGEALAIWGASGSGKSTLAKAITGVWPLMSGEIRLDKATIDQYDRQTFGKLIGYLPQNVSFFQGTIAENIARMAINLDSAAVEAAARKAHAHELIASLPQGYDTMLDGKDGMLSGGQRQRVALARALYGDPILLVLDEPSSALDDWGSKALNRAVEEAKSNGNAVIIMTHSNLTMATCTKVLVLHGGAVYKYGSREKVFREMNEENSKVRKLSQNK